MMQSQYHPVMKIPPDTIVLDLSQGRDPRPRPNGWSVGRYGEKRKGLYTTELFGGVRDIHMGIDIGAPVGTPIYAFTDCEIHLFGNNPAAGDYGYTLITKQVVEGRDLYALFGHLSRSSIEGKSVGQKFYPGEVLAWVGNHEENGGWRESHLHFQLSRIQPQVCDMPGAVTDEDFPAASLLYPDPRTVLGPLY